MHIQNASERSPNDTTDRYDCLVAGHICLDIIPAISGEVHFVPGQLMDIGPATFGTGGPVSNTGLALHKLGIRTRLTGKLGDDLFGKAVRQTLLGHDPSLAEAMLEISGELTSYSIIVSPPGQDRMIFHYPGCNDRFEAKDVSDELLSRIRLFHFGYPPVMQRMFENDGIQLEALFRRAKAMGATTSLDMSMPDPDSPAGRANWRSVLSRTLPYVDIFLPSLEETIYTLYPGLFQRVSQTGGNPWAVVGPHSIVSIGRDLLAMGTKLAGLKLGSKGLYLTTCSEDALAALGRAKVHDPGSWANRQLWSPCFQTHVGGTTGAGDTTLAGFLAAFLRGLPPEEAVTVACAVGACCVEAPDSLSGLKSWEETRHRIAANWLRAPLSLEMAENGFCQESRLWYGPDDARRRQALGGRDREGGAGNKL